LQEFQEALTLALPATTCSVEWSFNTLCRVKTLDQINHGCGQTIGFMYVGSASASASIRDTALLLTAFNAHLKTHLFFHLV